MIRLLAACLVVLAQSLASEAQAVGDPTVVGAPTAVSTVLRLADTVDVMQREGLAYGDDLAAELFPKAGGARWKAAVAHIYDPAPLKARFTSAFERRLGRDPAVLQPIVAFFGSPRGQVILGLEIEARKALLDKAAEEAARVAVDDMRAARNPRLDLLTRFATVNDLVEQNVAGALNANLAFYRGMAAGGAFGTGGMTEADIMAQVSAQEPQIRSDTEDWLYPYLSLAYDPLSEVDLRAYLDFSATPAAQQLNAAMFGASEEVFVGISQDLGKAAADMLSGQEL